MTTILKTVTPLNSAILTIFLPFRIGADSSDTPTIPTAENKRNHILPLLSKSPLNTADTDKKVNIVRKK